MNIRTDAQAEEGKGWEWRKPSPVRFLLSLAQDVWNFLKGPLTWRSFLAWALILLSIPSIYAYRYVLLHPLFLTLRMYAIAILAVGLVVATSWWLLGKAGKKWLPQGYGRYFAPVGAILVAWLVVAGASYGKNLHGFFSQYWRFVTLTVVEPKIDPLTDHERVWSLDGIHTFARRQMRDTEAPSKPNLVRDGKNFYWTMGVEPTTWLLQYWEPVEEVVRIRSDITSFELSRSRNARFATGESLQFSRNVYTCTQRRFWFWNAFSHEITRTTLYLKDDAGKWVQVIPIIRWTGWVFPRPEFGGVMVVNETPERSWLGERLETLKRVFWGCGTWIAPEQIASHQYLTGQNIVPFEVTRYMAASLRFRNGFWAPTPLRKEGDIRIADMPDDQNEQPFTLFFHIRNDKGEIVSSKLYQYVALEPYDAAHQGHVAELLHPADGIGPSYVYWFFGERGSLTGVSAVPGWVRSSRRNYDWATNLPNEQRPYIKDIADSNGVVKTRRMWLTAVVTIDKKKYDGKDPKGFITGSPDIVITDARKNRSVWVNSDNPADWPEQLRKELGPIWVEP
jgi:hypothetical protein